MRKLWALLLPLLLVAPAALTACTGPTDDEVI